MNVYIHIPFCKNKCSFCHFCSYTDGNKFFKKYFDAVKKEIALNISKFNIKKVNTIYFGGGSPSYVPSKYIVEIITLLKSLTNFNKNIEITIETNPEDLNEEKILKYKDTGINRISIGVQSFDKNILNSMNRTYDYIYLKDKMLLLNKYQFKNINIDLIFGYPKQTLKSWVDTVNKAISLNPTHISCYSLEIEENTEIYNKIYFSHTMLTPSETMDRKMYHEVIKILKRNNYLQYEISNFSKNNYKCEHNLDFWNNKEYIGFGVSAVGYINKTEYINTNSLINYINGKYCIYENRFTNKDIYKRKISLGLRLSDGLTISNKEPIMYKLKLNNYIKFQNENCTLNKNGVDFYNRVFSLINS